MVGMGLECGGLPHSGYVLHLFLTLYFLTEPLHSISKSLNLLVALLGNRADLTELTHGFGMGHHTVGQLT